MFFWVKPMDHMKQLMLCLLLSIAFQTAFGQVTGKLTDTSGKPVPFATAALMRSADSTIINSATVNDTGTFSIDGAQPGKYFMCITAVGYQTYKSAIFDLSQGAQADLGRLVIKQTGRRLNEVVIKADKPQVQQTAEGVTVSVQNSIMTQGS